ncbi:hypothetical protein [Cryobacterium tagatosivorans]|uniref:Uncharacterized protein n=1 Tax=Cryobacterium tagatosivorans TaxID=1259199 RepID=A0A4R8U9S4_9MICO|nr:hypothetical protein [Cryobacterium tagatosivorans]TFB46506.1 hypothetical protein E3O23_17105 [Cryobacterium tagatosivorans]
MTTAKTTTPATADELRAALAALEAQEQAEQKEQAALIQTAQAARAQKVFDANPALEAELARIGDAQYGEAVAAAIAGDLNAAYSGFVSYLGARAARSRARSDAQGAANLLRREPHTTANIEYRQQPFSDFIDSNLHKAIEANANTAIAPYLEPDIDDAETAAAYLDQGK